MRVPCLPKSLKGTAVFLKTELTGKMVAESDSVMVAAAAELPSPRNPTCCVLQKKEVCTVKETVQFIATAEKPVQDSPPKPSISVDTPETRQKGKTKRFKKAPELQKFTFVDFPSKTCVRRCGLCDDCFTCFCGSEFAITSKENGLSCFWHSGLEKGSNCDNELDCFADDEYDELETVAEEWTEKLHKRHNFSKENRRRKQGDHKRPKRAVKEKQFRPEYFQKGTNRYPLIIYIMKQDIRSRNAARKERLEDAFAAKKENIDKKLKALKRPRRGPPNNCHITAMATPAQQKQQSQKYDLTKYELREGDVSQFATSEDEAHLLTVLCLVQHRDLLPEDYDLLLSLDEKVSKKTLGSNRLRRLRTKLLTDDDVNDIMNSDFAGATCAVCMECYHADEFVKWLPCEHVFHSNCIDQWLTEAGSICPLDGLEA